MAGGAAAGAPLPNPLPASRGEGTGSEVGLRASREDEASSSLARRTSADSASCRVDSNDFDVDCMFRISRGAVPRLKKKT